MTTNLLNLSRSPITTFIKGFFRKPTAAAPVTATADEDARRIITVHIYRPYTDRITNTYTVRCPVSAAPARIAQRIAMLKNIPGNYRVWMTDTHLGGRDPATGVGVTCPWDYRYRILRQDNTVGVRFIDPRRR